MMLGIRASANLNSSQSDLPSLKKEKGHVLTSVLGLAQGLSREARDMGSSLGLFP